MNNLRNRVNLIGHLGQDPEVTQFETGKVKVKFNLATNESYKNEKGEKVEDTQWHHIVAWGKQAENLGKYAKKGSEIALEGKLSTRKYEDKEGVSRTITEITANDFLLLDKKQPA